MAVVTRYFSDSAAGAGDGTTWANRAALLSAGAFSTVITAFNFGGSDSLLCYIEGSKTYTITNDLASADFSVAAPTVANPLMLHGCDSSGVALAVPDPDWTSDQPAFSTSKYPVIATTTNIRTINLSSVVGWSRCVAFTASGCNQAMLLGMCLDWCSVISSTANTSAAAVATGTITNSVLKCTGASYSLICGVVDRSVLYNVRIEGVTGSSGNRHGVTIDSNGTCFILKSTIVGCGGNGVNYVSGTTGQYGVIDGCTIANNGAKGVLLNATASQTYFWHIRNSCITGHSTNGIDAGAARVICTNNRLRDNSTNFANFGNHPTDFNYTTDSDDASEYVDSGAGDYRIRYDAIIAELGYGVSVENETQPTPEQVAAAMWDDTFSPHRTLT